MKINTLIIVGVFFLLPSSIMPYIVLLPDMNIIDSRHTGNPNECWYEDENGTMLPCQIETGESTFFVIYLIMASPIFMIGTILLIIIRYVGKRKHLKK